MSSAVTDTHALIWYATGAKKRLGSHARRIFEQADEGRAKIYVPTLVLAELAEALVRGRIRLPTSLSLFVDALFSSPSFEPSDLGVDIVLVAADMPMIRDPRDRLIAATASHLDVPLMTCDADIAASEQVRILW